MVKCKCDMQLLCLTWIEMHCAFPSAESVLQKYSDLSRVTDSADMVNPANFYCY